MHKKYIIKLSLLLSCGAAFTACDDRLDLVPQNSVEANIALTNTQDVESAVIGMYGNLDRPALYGTNLILVPDLLASDDYIRWDGTFQSYREISRKSITNINAEAERTWIRAYQNINLANTVIEALPLVDQDRRDQFRGEALLIRAMMHFELVRLYGLPWVAGTPNTQLGVPIMLAAVNTEEEASFRPARATVAQVYQQVITDLTEAKALLPEANGVRGNKFIVSAFLARVYLQQSEFALARDEANAVIESGYYNLNPIVGLIFSNDNTAESIFEIQQNDQNNAGTSNDGLTTFYASLDQNGGTIGRGDVRIEYAFQDLYDSTDTRRTDLIYVGVRGVERLRTRKYTNFGANIPVIRLAEMLLIRAETNLRLGTTVGAAPLEDVNAIRLRANAVPLAIVTVEDILFERELELAFEGFRIHDIKRTMGLTGDVPYNDPSLVLPIPQREIDSNLNLVQNEGY